ncbi:MAG: ATP-binding cassette domain-containing protein [Opitutaceae bacterium]|nr:ATP-binding cassette domain-containing protein [Opitutaceae bacterium]
MALLSLLDVSLSFGGPAVLENLNFQIDPGERVCLLGRNGAGKSSLMRVISGEIKPDRGDVFRPGGAVYTRLTQEIPDDVIGVVRDVVSSGLRPNADHHEEDWERDVRVDDLIARLQVPAEADFAALSGGLKRRALLARALAGQPDLLLLDEPTNHLDLDSILWLENFLLTEKLSLFFVTHDRAFLRKLATRIVELDRGKLTSWSCDYDTFLVRKDELLLAEEKQRAAFDKKLAQEEEWLRRGVKARRTRDMGRVARLKEMRGERKARREVAGTVNLRMTEAGRSGVKVIDAEKISFGYPGGPLLVRDFSTVITRGDKLGLIGPNGAGKTTFIKLLLGALKPTAGTLKHGTQMEVLYFDQMRAQIDGDKSVAENIADGNETVTINGKTRHVISYLQDFLFEPDRARTPARVLSGGERNRLLLARLFTKPANVLVLDEPTNDLDAETLDLLENLLVEYEGTLIVVSHDRDFLDNVVTGTLVFEGDGRITEYVGGYSDWMAEKAKQAAKAVTGAGVADPDRVATKSPGAATPATAKPKKLTNKERAELEALPARIEALETEQAELVAKLGDPDFYKNEAAKFAAVKARLDEVEAEHAAAFARWEELESLAATLDS